LAAWAWQQFWHVEARVYKRVTVCAFKARLMRETVGGNWYWKVNVNVVEKET
jgi:hypothetical protein